MPIALSGLEGRTLEVGPGSWVRQFNSIQLHEIISTLLINLFTALGLPYQTGRTQLVSFQAQESAVLQAGKNSV